MLMKNRSRYALASVAALSTGLAACSSPETGIEASVISVELASYYVMLGSGTVEVSPDICYEALSPRNSALPAPQPVALAELTDSVPQEVWTRQDLRDWSSAQATIDGCMQAQEFFAYANEIGSGRKLYEQPVQIDFIVECEFVLDEHSDFCTPLVRV